MKEIKEVVGACHLDCPDGCSWVVTLEDGVPVKLRGNKEHPFTRGTLCVKVNPYIEFSQRPDRLLYPLRRIGRKGSGQFERITWDEALSTIAENMQQTIAEHGAEAILPYAGTGTMGWVQGHYGAGQRLFNYIGASEHDGTICSVSGHVGVSYTTGSAAGMVPEDMAQAGIMLLWGTNTLVTNRHLWPFLKEAKDRGAPLVVIDPIRSKTAQRADIHIAPKPGTDGALALGLMHRLVEIGAADLDYLATRTLDFDGFNENVLADFTVEKAAAICDISAETIINLADLIKKHRPMAIRTAQGMQRHAGGGQASRVISCLPALTGDYSRLGGGFVYSAGPFYKLNSNKLTGRHLRKQPARSLAMTRLGHSLLELNDPPVKTLLMWAANPVVSNPDQKRIRQGLEREDLFTVVIDNFQTDSADYADIILPGTMQLEHHDLNESYSHLHLHWNEKAIDPPGECLRHTEIFRRLSKHLGLTEPSLFVSDEELTRAALDSDHSALDGVTLESLREKGWQRMNYPEQVQPFLERFETASGLFEFRSEQAEADGFGLYPHFVDSAEVSQPANGTLALITPANNFLLNSIFANSQKKAGSGDPIVIVHPDDAIALGLVDGAMVCVGNARGEFMARLSISDEARPGIAITSKGLWAKHSDGISVNITVDERDSDMGRGAVYHDNRVWIKKYVG